MTEPTPKVLAIDDDKVWLDQVPLILEDDCEVICCSTIDQGLLALGMQFFDIVLLDLNFDGDSRTGLDVFRQIAAIDSATDVVVISGETRPDRLVQIMNAGVTHFIAKPSSPNDIRIVVREVLRKREMRSRANSYALSGTSGCPPLVGNSRQMAKLRSEIDQVIQSDIRDILLIGETGTGKDVVARTIAGLADPSKRFIPIHCAAISDGIAESELFGHVKGAFTGAERDRASAFESVGGGFVFLDEIGDMPLHQQAKLLRVLQERKVQRVGSIEERAVSFKCVSATNIDIPRAIAEKRFREDLYYRVAKVKISIPPLRERTEDIPELVHFFLNSASPKKSTQITDDAVYLLQSYSWPGNIRQLQTVVEFMSFKCTNNVIREKDVCSAVPEISQIFSSKQIRPVLGKRVRAVISAERQRFQKAIIDANGDRSKAAALLHISRATFFRRAKELGLVTPRREN